MPPEIFDTEICAVPIGELLHRRMTVLGLTKSELVTRWGYSNVAKGLRRLHQIEDGGYEPNDDQLGGLASALQLPMYRIYLVDKSGQIVKRNDFPTKTR